MRANYFLKVRCYDPDTGMHCDVNVNERLGFLNTSLIKRYCEHNPILPDVIYRIKQWAKNQPWSSHINNYSLAVMTIGVFQVRSSYVIKRQ